MKFIHLSDLHLGKRVNEFSMLEDQQYILTEILHIIDAENPDGVLIAGDVYDKSVPSAEAVALLDDFLVRLSRRNLRVFLISGNHDSPERMAFGGRLMEGSGIHLAPVYNGKVTPVTLTDEYGPVKVYLYLQTEEAAESDEDNINQYSEEDESTQDEEENSFDSAKQRRGLQTLLDIILMVHQNKPAGSKWEQTFDFREYFSRLKYAPAKNNFKIDPKALRRFILELLRAIEQENDGERTQKFFVDYYLQNFDVKDQNKFEKDVSIKWNNILNSLDVIDRSEKIFADARIGIIRLTNATPLDAQNIFSRINRGGTQLKAEELLSAKPYWNKSVNLSDQTVIDRVKEMYGNLGIPAPDSIVRWDIAATLISRIKDQNLIFDTYEDVRKKKEISMDEISLGFKLLSSIYAQGMSNKQVNELEQDESIKWEYDIDELLQQLNKITAN